VSQITKYNAQSGGDCIVAENCSSSSSIIDQEQRCRQTFPTPLHHWAKEYSIQGYSKHHHVWILAYFLAKHSRKRSQCHRVVFSVPDRKPHSLMGPLPDPDASVPPSDEKSTEKRPLDWSMSVLMSAPDWASYSRILPDVTDASVFPSGEKTTPQ